MKFELYKDMMLARDLPEERLKRDDILSLMPRGRCSTRIPKLRSAPVSETRRSNLSSHGLPQNFSCCGSLDLLRLTGTAQPRSADRKSSIPVQQLRNSCSMRWAIQLPSSPCRNPPWNRSAKTRFAACALLLRFDEFAF
jgi:hypothetical protein